MDKRSLGSILDWIALGVGFAVMAVGVLWADRLPAWSAYLWPPLVLLGLVGAVRILWRAMGMGRVEEVQHPPATAISDETWALLLAEKEKADKAQDSTEETEESRQ